MTDLRYPIGKFSAPDTTTSAHLQSAVDDIASLPSELRQAVQGLTDAQLDTPYRPDGWTVRQVVHHIADSHMNAFIRMRKALTEPEPTISAYDEKRWAELPDSKDGDIEISLALIDGLHQRWAMLLRSLDADRWKRGFQHPERGHVSLDFNTLLYAWHCKHHLAHIANLRQREKW